ncbi:MAG TPA: BREX system ATP-binding protein BrxD [Thermoanaerobaculia bacterium]
MSVSPQRRQEVLDALRRGTVPQRGLDLLAVGLERFEPAVGQELETAAKGAGVFKALRGEYGSGKTFFARWLCERARRRSFATAEVQISETETPLHRLETVYRRLIERLATSAHPSGALRGILDAWFFTLEQDVLAEGEIDEQDGAALLARSHDLMERRLADISRSAPAFAAALRGYREATAAGRTDIAEGLLAWIGGQPNVSAEAKRAAKIKGEIDHFGALSFLQGLLVVLRDSGHPGLVVVMDEVETLQRVRGDVRDKGLNALRQLLDEIDAGRFPGLYLLITGTPAFFEGPMGVQRLPPLAQRLQVDFATDARFDNPRAVQIRLRNFDLEGLEELGRRVRDLQAEASPAAERLRALASDVYLSDLARAIAGELGGKVGIAPRLFLKKLVADVLDRIEQFPDFDPRQHYALTVNAAELTREEQGARGAVDPEDVELEL